MSILIDSETKVLVQGITGRAGRFHTSEMLRYGTRIVAGITPGKGSVLVEGIPVYDTVAEAQRHSSVDATVIFVPGPAVYTAVMDAINGGIALIVCVTEGVPVHDLMRLLQVAKERGAVIVGPNTPGIISPGRSKIGIMPGNIHKPGSVGVVSRSGTLTYEAVHQMTLAGLGQSTCVGIGGDQLTGMTFSDVLRLFESDRETSVVLMIGEIGGCQEEDAASYVRTMTKPVYAYIAGATAPPGRRMGHAGALISGGKGSYKDKVAALAAAGCRILANPAAIGEEMAREISQSNYHKTD